MKKIFTIMFAVLMVTAMGVMSGGDAWAEGASTTVKTESDGKGGGTTTVTNSGETSVTREQTKDSTSGGHSTNWHIGYDNNAGGTFFNKLLSGSGVGGTSGSSHGNAGTFVTTVNGAGAANVSGTGGIGIGGYAGMAGGTAANLGSAIWGTVTGKLLDLFGNVKTVLYILAAFGLVGFAFMALFGKVRWGWVCALAFGLAAVAAAGQIIDYVSQAGVGGAMYDTLGTNTY